MGRIGTVVTVEAGEAMAVVLLLELLSALPSTPEAVADEARVHMADIEERLPAFARQQGPGARQRGGVVELEPPRATAIAGLLELLAELPSTPPAVVDEARSHAERMWFDLSVEVDEPGAGRGRPPGGS